MQNCTLHTLQKLFILLHSADAVYLNVMASHMTYLNVGAPHMTGGKGVKVAGTPLDEPAMPEQHIDTSSLGGWWKTVMGNGKKLSKLGIHVDTWQGTEAHPNKLASLGVNR